jgi:hypothetical protein
MSMEGIGGVIRRRIAQPPRNSEEKNEHLPGIEVVKAKKERYIHSDAHALAAEISAYFGERKKFGAYLAVIKRLGVPQARTAFSSIKTEDMNVRQPRKFFMWLSKSGKTTTPPVKKTGKKPKDKQLDMNRFFR